MAIPKVRTFISFDYDHDLDLARMLAGQAKNADSPFTIVDYTVKEAFTGDWKKKVKAKIQLTSVVAVICGHHTETATGVNAEIRIARELGKPYFLLAGRKSGTNKKPTAAQTTDKMYSWTWKNLRTLIHGGR